jgi:co-chaperonin GroES (HSP10)
MRQIIPTKDFIVMEVRHKETNRIVLPEEYDKLKMMHQFEVVLAGPKCVEVKVGDAIVVDPMAVIKFDHNHCDYFLTREENVGAVIRETEE